MVTTWYGQTAERSVVRAEVSAPKSGYRHDAVHGPAQTSWQVVQPMRRMWEKLVPYAQSRGRLDRLQNSVRRWQRSGWKEERRDWHDVVLSCLDASGSSSVAA